MLTKTSFVLCSTLSFLLVLGNTPENAFQVVSTTQKPPSSPTFEEKLSQMQGQITEINSRLKLLDHSQGQGQEFSKITSEFSSLSQKLEARMKSMEENINEISVQLKSLQSHDSVQVNSLMLAPLARYLKAKTDLAKNCKEIKERGYNTSNIYLIKPGGSPNVIAAFCDMDKRGGGWTYILHRYDGSEDFNRGWNDYKGGFGNLETEFWLGLENIHYLTGYEVNELLIELVDWNKTETVAHFTSFSIGSEAEGYKLKVIAGYSGTAGDSLSYSANMKFTTKDKDQDLWAYGNCANDYSGAWWFNNCMRSLLTGNYLKGTVPNESRGKGVYWKLFHGDRYSLKEVRMMVKPRDVTRSQS